MYRVHLAGGRGNTISLLRRRAEKKKKNLECLAGIKVESWVRPRKNIRRSAKNRVTRTWIGGCSERREEGGGGHPFRKVAAPKSFLFPPFLVARKCGGGGGRRRIEEVLLKTTKDHPPLPPHFFMSTSSPTLFGRSPTERKVNSEWPYYSTYFPIFLFFPAVFSVVPLRRRKEGQHIGHNYILRQNAIFFFLDKERKYT